MKFGLFMMPLHPPRRSYADSYDRDIELIVQADRLGYHEAWIGEHITETWENAPVPELLIAQALALTNQIVMATGVTMLPLHHPVDTAHRIPLGPIGGTCPPYKLVHRRAIRRRSHATHFPLTCGPDLNSRRLYVVD